MLLVVSRCLLLVFGVLLMRVGMRSSFWSLFLIAFFVVVVVARCGSVFALALFVVRCVICFGSLCVVCCVDVVVSVCCVLLIVVCCFVVVVCCML